MQIDGILPIAKPYGMVSKDVSRRLVKVLGRCKIGHAGTLDPLASGVLPILLGKATRLQDFLIGMPKAYEFDVTFGYETTTLDAEGEVVCRGPDSFNEQQVKEVSDTFKGQITQIPPLFSAVKYQGKPLYQYARTGADVSHIPDEALSRKVEVYGIEMVSLNGPVATLRVRCSKGTYVRVLAKDIAKALNTCGTVTRLVRTMSAGISLQDSVSLEQLEKDPASVSGGLKRIEDIELAALKVRFSEISMVSRLKNGLPLTLDRVSFHTMIKGKNSARVDTGSDLLLISPDGVAFGIGSISTISADQYVTRMRRGL